MLAHRKHRTLARREESATLLPSHSQFTHTHIDSIATKTCLSTNNFPSRSRRFSQRSSYSLSSFLKNLALSPFISLSDWRSLAFSHLGISSFSISFRLRTEAKIWGI